MKPRKAHDVRSDLQRKGFRPTQTDHEKWTLYVGVQKTTVHTKISHGQEECDGFVLAQMARQLCLSTQELADLLDCPLSYEAYVRLLAARKRDFHTA